MTLSCSTCTGTGEISEERARWIEEGRRLRRYRLDHEPDYLSMGRAARQHGVTPGQWGDAEQGRVDPAPLIARLLGAEIWEGP